MSELVGRRVWIRVRQVTEDPTIQPVAEAEEMPTEVTIPNSELVWMEGLVTATSDSHVTVDTGDESFTVDPGGVRDKKPVREPQEKISLSDADMQKLAQNHPDKW